MRFHAWRIIIAANVAQVSDSLVEEQTRNRVIGHLPGRAGALVNHHAGFAAVRDVFFHHEITFLPYVGHGDLNECPRRSGGAGLE